ncbi:hypothetical protein MUK42_28160 [Musa troglodytarum]|uniref:Uncharacterized protein n=1 Tax=Musa troglodytarum TaxID=320322 RepID=A0A9E7KD50_9LILI|nr:hypothetical protein MUK42_28160 [Musa troglodytarum]
MVCHQFALPEFVPHSPVMHLLSKMDCRASNGNVVEIFWLKLVKIHKNMLSIVQGFTAYHSASFGFVCMERYTRKCNCDSRHHEQSLPPEEDKKKWQ